MDRVGKLCHMSYVLTGHTGVHVSIHAHTVRKVEIIQFFLANKLCADIYQSGGFQECIKNKETNRLSNFLCGWALFF